MVVCSSRSLKARRSMSLVHHASRLIRLLLPYAEAVAIVGLVAAGGRFVIHRVEVPNISSIFVVPVLLAAVRHGLFPSLWAACLSVLAYDYLFLPPLYQFSIAHPADVVALLFLLLVALVASVLAARAHGQKRMAQREARTTAQLYDFSRKISGVANLDDLLAMVAVRLSRALDAGVVILMPQDGRLVHRAAFPADAELSKSDLAAAERAWEYDYRSGGVNDPVTPSSRVFAPVHTGRAQIGVVAVLPRDPPGRLSPEERDLLDALCGQSAVAIERLTLADDAEKARLGAERERLRSAMLTSVSHDLRTPLASIVGALSSLRSYASRYDESMRDELLRTALGEAERLDRFVGNLLDMTRLDAGAIVPRRETVEVGDLISTMLRRAVPVLKDRVVASSVARDLPTLSLDFVLAEQALFNLVDNATKHSAPDGRIELEARRADGRVEIVVRDEGPGIAPAALGRLFDKFYRADDGDRRRAGTGLGLAIAKGFVEIQDGTIAARNRGDRSGAEFVISYPA
jgi:two-component system sensor histidine kinase KdpD